MKLENLIAGLDSPQSNIRNSVAQVLGMVEETRALGAIGEHYKTETDPAVRETLGWAGKRIFAAHKRDYATVEEIFRHFDVNREIENMTDEEETALLKRMQEKFDADMASIKSSAGQQKAMWSAAAGLAGAAIGGSAMGFGMMGTVMQPGAEIASSNLGKPYESELANKRAPAPLPSSDSIELWVRRLHESDQPRTREQACIELSTLNNPTALPHLAAAFLNDPSDEVRAAAEKFGKLLYWKAVYWQMEQDGTLEQEMTRRAEIFRRKRAVGELPQKPTQPEEPSPTATSEDIADILRRAQESRARRQRR